MLSQVKAYFIFELFMLCIFMHLFKHFVSNEDLPRRHATCGQQNISSIWIFEIKYIY